MKISYLAYSELSVIVMTTSSWVLKSNPSGIDNEIELLIPSSIGLSSNSGIEHEKINNENWW